MVKIKAKIEAAGISERGMIVRMDVWCNTGADAKRLYDSINRLMPADIILSIDKIEVNKK